MRAFILATRDTHRPEYYKETQMSKSKSVALAGVVAVAAMLVGPSVFAAASATPTTPKEVETQCLKDAKAKGLTGDALKAAEKSCKDAYAKTKK